MENLKWRDLLGMFTEIIMQTNGKAEINKESLDDIYDCIKKKDKEKLGEILYKMSLEINEK